MKNTGSLPVFFYEKNCSEQWLNQIEACNIYLIALCYY